MNHKSRKTPRPGTEILTGGGAAVFFVSVPDLTGALSRYGRALPAWKIKAAQCRNKGCLLREK